MGNAPAPQPAAGQVVDAAGHGTQHAHDEHRAEEAEPLGPVDPLAWAAGALGVALGLLVAACFALATSGLGAL